MIENAVHGNSPMDAGTAAIAAIKGYMREHIKLLEQTASEVNLHFSVSDTGEGIPSQYLEKTFEKFGQAELRRQSFRVGSGLGLTFCKLAVESHGGKIWVKSDVGKGSEFFVELPGPPAEAAAKAPAFPSTKISK